MKKVTFVLFFLLSLRLTCLAGAPIEFFAGKWEILVVGTPNGDAQLIATLTPVDGKLTGEISRPDQDQKIKISSVLVQGDKLLLEFSTPEGYDVTLELEKVDDNTLKGNVMNMFDAKAVRLKG